MADALDTGELPVALSLPVSITARNADLKLDIIGRATHLDEKGLVATLQVEVPEGTVLFTTIDMRSINSTVRGLIKVKSQAAIGEHGAIARSRTSSISTMTASAKSPKCSAVRLKISRRSPRAVSQSIRSRRSTPVATCARRRPRQTRPTIGRPSALRRLAVRTSNPRPRARR